MHQSIETPSPDPRGIAGDSGDLTQLMRGFNTHLTTCCPPGGGGGAVELTRCLFHPGHKRGFNAHIFESGDSNGEPYPSFLQKQLFEGINSL